MVTLEQVKLLETKVIKAIDFVKQVTEENSLLKGKLDSYQKRIDELEVLVQRFKEDQGRIEDGILSALDRLNQFEDAIEKSLAQARPAAETVKESGGKPAAGEAFSASPKNGGIEAEDDSGADENFPVDSDGPLQEESPKAETKGKDAPQEAAEPAQNETELDIF